MSQGELFGGPPVPPPRMATAPPAARYVKYRPVSRVICDDCARAVHDRGWQHAPPVRRARWRRIHNTESIVLCEIHKLERQERE